MKLYLIRSGKTDYDSENRLKGILDIPLNEEGIDEMRGVAEELSEINFDSVYTGKVKSAKQSADIIATKLHKKVKVKELFQEVNLGLWQGLLEQEVKQKHPKSYKQWHENPSTVCSPEGEPFQNALERVNKGISRIAKKYNKQDNTILLVAPRLLASVVKCLLSQSDLNKIWEITENIKTIEVFQI